MSSVHSLLSSQTVAYIKERNNFDLIRFFLAFSVFFSHFSVATQTPTYWFLGSAASVKGFFVISGFLVSFSFINKPEWKTYTHKRVRRIMPAYLVVIALSVLCGMFCTILPLKTYLTSEELYRYILANASTLNFIQPTLPGLFSGNPLHEVNVSLWTIKVELMLYATVPFVLWLLKRYHKAGLLLFIYIASFLYSFVFDHLYEQTGQSVFDVVKRQFPGQMMYFYSGTAILLYFEWFKRHLKYLLPVAWVLYVCKGYSFFVFFEPIALAVLIIGIAYGIPLLNRFNKIGNCSYSIYLLHFPIIQLLIQWQIVSSNYLLALICAVFLTIGGSIILWKYVEKPFMYSSRKLKN